MALKITAIKVNPAKNGAGNGGNGHIIIENTLRIYFTIVMSSSGQPFVKWPNRDRGQGLDPKDRWFYLVSWVDKETDDAVKNKILDEFNRVVGIPQKKSVGVTFDDMDSSYDQPQEPVGSPEPPVRKSPMIQWKKKD